MDELVHFWRSERDFFRVCFLFLFLRVRFLLFKCPFYFYFNLNSAYTKDRLKIGASYTTYSSSESLDGIINFSDDFQVPFIKNNLNYFIQYELPVDKKAFSFIFKLNGRYLDINSGAVNFNSLPMIVNYSGNNTIKKNDNNKST